MAYRFYTTDVFTEHRFGGNPLAVLPDARGLDGDQMQQIAREFNYSESTFVLPPEDASNTRRVRIFTPGREIPFAGHPNVGTAFVLAATGEVELGGDETELRFEEQAGIVPVTVSARDGRPVSCELIAPNAISLGEPLAVELVAAALSLSPADVATATHPPQVASVGLPFVLVELASREALERAQVDAPGFRAMSLVAGVGAIHLYTRAVGEDGMAERLDVRARMYAPGDGVSEDPATGSANCALAGLLARYHPDAEGDFETSIAQGVEMGRPSRLEARVAKRGGEVIEVRIGGASVLVAEGTIAV